MLKQKIKKLAHQYAQDIIANRRYLHTHPELSYQEFETARFVAQKLRVIGLEPQENVAGTGVTVLIEGKNPSKKTVALRADMDALPIVELNDIPYKSQNKGVMHACGHDAHTASLLGVARILHDLKDQFEGTFKLLFQHGEERVPGGARLMVEAGVLQTHQFKHILGQHVFNDIPVGKVLFKPGPFFASADELYLTVKGKGGHGAMPESAIDPVLIASHIIVALQQVISRNNSPKSPSVLSFGKVTAEGATNIIPNEVKLAGTFRAFDEKWRKEGLEKIRKMASGIAEAMGGSCQMEDPKGYPSLYNHHDTTQEMYTHAVEFLGAEKVILSDDFLIMGAEDFAFYTHQIPGCFYMLGTGNAAKGIDAALHNPNFNIDEDALEIGAGLMSWLAIQSLHNS